MKLKIGNLTYEGHYYSYEYAITVYKPKKYFYFYTNDAIDQTSLEFKDIKNELIKNNNILTIIIDNVCQNYIFDDLDFYYYDDINNIFTLVGNI